MSIDAIMQAVADERARQDARFGREHDAALTPADWLAILGKQVGDVCMYSMDRLPNHLRHELIQVAAVCGAWAQEDRTDADVLRYAVDPEHFAAVVRDTVRSAEEEQLKFGRLCRLVAAFGRIGDWTLSASAARVRRTVLAAHAVAWAAALDGEGSQ